MENLKVRLQKITLQNIKNTKNGEIEFPVAKNYEREASIVGLYGPNGSGKSAVIVALSILKTLMSGSKASDEIFNIICKESDDAYLKFDFHVSHYDFVADISYEFTLEKDYERSKVLITNEIVKYRRLEDSKTLTLIDTSFVDENTLFTPKFKFEHVRKNKNVFLELFGSKMVAREVSESFVFRNDTIKALYNVWPETYEIVILERLKHYAKYNLFVILNQHHSQISSSEFMYFFFRIFDASANKLDSGVINLGYGKDIIDEQKFIVYENIVKQLSLIISEIVPGMKLISKNYGPEILKDGRKGFNVELMSVRNGVEIPFKYESDGIKKIVSVLSALIAMFNYDGILVAIDELDSGVYEYLLGSLLEVINDSGKGQLIFTSHNLHPLELLSSDNIVFTTTNPYNRYIKFTNVKETNNLRDFYLREIILRATGQKEVVFDDIKKYKISRSFRKAKEIAGD